MLTLDYCIKLIEIEERRQAVVPTIIMGETGVGKSECLRIYSMLVNEGHQLAIGQQVAGFVLEFCKETKSQLSAPCQPLDTVAVRRTVSATHSVDSNVVAARY